MKPSDVVGATSLSSPQSITMLVVMPFINISSFLWCYTALPLHFVDSGWPLWQLGMLLTLCYIPRLLATALFKYIGDWLCVLISAVAVASSSVVIVRPDSIVAVWVAICCICPSICPTAYRSFAYDEFLGSGEWQMQRALRIFTLADTAGYASAPFIGGALYDLGGLRACAVWSVFATGAGVLLPLTIKPWRRSFAKSCHRVSAAPTAHQACTETSPVPHAPSTTKMSPTPTNGLAAARDGAAPKLRPVSVLATMGAAYANICVYGVEWCLYALYFRNVHGWSGTWTGFAQMGGDLLAGDYH